MDFGSDSQLIPSPNGDIYLSLDSKYVYFALKVQTFVSNFKTPTTSSEEVRVKTEFGLSAMV